MTGGTLAERGRVCVLFYVYVTKLSDSRRTNSSLKCNPFTLSCFWSDQSFLYGNSSWLRRVVKLGTFAVDGICRLRLGCINNHGNIWSTSRLTGVLFFLETQPSMWSRFICRMLVYFTIQRCTENGGKEISMNYPQDDRCLLGKIKMFKVQTLCFFRFMWP